MAKTIGIIPARYASSRLMGKALVDIGGKSMIQSVYEQASLSNVLDEVWVATDDERIASTVVQFGGKVIMTAITHQSGTDRCAEAVRLCCPDASIVINIQGDEPFILPEQIDLLANLLQNPAVQIGTLAKAITTNDELFDSNKPKVVMNKMGVCLLFSRQTVPFVRHVPPEQWLQHHLYYKHIGMYGYQAAILQQLTSLPLSSLEQAESLEQLRWIENGFVIHVAITEHETLSIDTSTDLDMAKKWWAVQQKLTK